MIKSRIAPCCKNILFKRVYEKMSSDLQKKKNLKHYTSN